ncbi:hybrid sensor histidine kinase/response regulator [Verrucomicrobiales bacterium BCK34]|nr:hybrid sensor histidine kinase/response regulator [Verrucomicrobiales bacterium BCK34]
MQLFQEKVGTILIVDDEVKNVQVVGTMLSAFGYDFMIAQDGEQALQRVESQVPDLVLLDIQMPGMDGFETCKAFGQLDYMADVPIIFLSANNEKNYIVKALESGGVDYVTKPFNKAELLARVRTHMELKLVRDERKLLQRNTDRFLEIMAHDLKNWVGSANFSAKLLKGMEGLPGKAPEIVDTIEESTGHALDFIGEFLRSARDARTEVELKEESIELRDLCLKAVSLIEADALRKEIKVECLTCDEAVTVRSDKKSLQRILDNLLTNAVKFSPESRAVTLELTDNPVKIVIEDEGPGFTGDDMEKLFKPYERLSAKPTGGEISTGLGLSIVKQLCDRLDIRIGVESSGEGQGARFTLRFGDQIGS